MLRRHKGFGDRDCPRCGFADSVHWMSQRIRSIGNTVVEQGFFQCQICGWKSKQYTCQIEQMKQKEAKCDLKKVFRDTYGRDPSSEEIRTFQEYINMVMQGRKKRILILECGVNEIKIKDGVTEECLAVLPLIH